MKITDEIAQIIDIAVDCWHDVVDDHGFKRCNRLRDMLVRRLIYFRGKPVETVPGEQKQQSDQ